jgi:hypothetical protein
MRPALPLAFLALASASLAQDEPTAKPRFRIGAGIAGGNFDFDTEGSALSDDTEALLLRLSFEGTGRRGIGGGIRFESLGTDDDLFQGTGFPRSEAAMGSAFAHFTYRFEEHRFAMPLRAGLLWNALVLEENVTNDQVEYLSVGPYFELAPEVTLARSGRTSWSLYGELGFGFGGTWIEIERDPRDYESVTFFGGIELGTRLLLNKIELGLAYVGRWQSMDESDPEGFPPQIALGYDAAFHGLLFTFGVVF